MTKIVNLSNDKYDVYIGRPSKWCNPFIIGRDGNREEVIEKYREWILSNLVLINNLTEIKDKTLGCFCKPKSCHGDVLVDLCDKEITIGELSKFDIKRVK